MKRVKLKEWIPSAFEARLLLFALMIDLLAYYGGRVIAQAKPHLCLNTKLDDMIPYMPWMILIYLGCYLFWGVNYILSVKADKKDALRFIAAHVIGEAVCFLCFVFFPTTMTRAAVYGDTFWDHLVQMTYAADQADNLLPSLHCFVSWMCWIGVRKNRRIPRWYRILSFLMAVAVCISTLAVKQHVIADVAAGIVLAEISYNAAGAFSRKLEEKREFSGNSHSGRRTGYPGGHTDPAAR